MIMSNTVESDALQEQQLLQMVWNHFNFAFFRYELDKCVKIADASHLEKSKQLHSCTLNNAGLFETKFGSNMDKSKCWVKIVISNFNCNFFSCIFNPAFGFVHI